MGGAIARSLLAGFVVGFGDAVNTSTITTTTSGLGTTQTIDTDKATKAGFGKGISQAAHDLQKFLLDLGKQAVPVIEIGALKHITVVVSEGVELEIRADRGPVMGEVQMLKIATRIVTWSLLLFSGCSWMGEAENPYKSRFKLSYRGQRECVNMTDANKESLQPRRIAGPPGRQRRLTAGASENDVPGDLVKIFRMLDEPTTPVLRLRRDAGAPSPLQGSR